MGDNPSHFRDQAVGDDFPVESVTWLQAVEFCRKLSELPAEKEAGRVYRLPTEAEWEYACRAGTTSPWHCGEGLAPAQANFSGRNTQRVGSYPPNAWGLYDMHGNVREWCSDYYDGKYYLRGPAGDPQGPETGSHRVARGGSWRDSDVLCRSAYRFNDAPVLADDHIGFRVVLVPAGK
jgi:formylglycine-generating enzyme required for sulfatase activity